MSTVISNWLLPTKEESQAEYSLIAIVSLRILLLLYSYYPIYSRIRSILGSDSSSDPIHPRIRFIFLPFQVFVRFLGCCSPNLTPKQQQHLLQKPSLARERQLLMTQEKAENGKSSDTAAVPLPVTSTIEQATANLLTLSNREEWKMVADVIDRSFFVIYSVGIILSLIFVFPSPCYNETSRV